MRTKDKQRLHLLLAGSVVASLVVVACGSTPTDARTGDAPSPRDEEGDAGAASGPQPSSPNKPSPSSNGAGGAASDETGSDDEGVAAQNAAGAPGTTEPMSSRARRPTRVVVKGGSMLGNTRDLYAMNLDGSDAVRFRGLDSLYSVAPRGDRVMLSGSRAASEGPLFYDVDGTNEVDLRSLQYDLGPILMSSGESIFYTTEKIGDMLPVWIAKTDGTTPTRLGEVAVVGNTRFTGESVSRDLFLFDRFVADAAMGSIYELPGVAPGQQTTASWSPSGERVAYLAPQTPAENGSDLTVWRAEDQTTEVIASTPAFPGSLSAPVWSLSEKYLGVSVQGGDSTEGLFLAGEGEGSRLVESGGGVRAIHDDGWFVVSRLVNNGERWFAYDLGTAEVALFDDQTHNVWGRSGYLAGCHPDTGELEVKAPSGTTLATVQATVDCTMTWSTSGQTLAYAASDGGLYVLSAGDEVPVEVTRPEGFASIIGLTAIKNGEGFTVVSQTEPNTWIYQEDGAFRVASPEVVLRLLDDAAFGGFSE